MFEDIITIPKKAKQIVCKYCESKDIETTRALISFVHQLFIYCKQPVKCYTCNNTYYINSIIKITEHHRINVRRPS